MWNWISCYISGKHDYGMWCEPGAIFLRCVHCGRRSPGWALNGARAASADKPRVKKAEKTGIATPSAAASRVIPFTRTVAS